MIDRTLRWLILMAAITPFLRNAGLGAEPLPPRAWACIGDHYFYHGPGITCAALSPDGRRAASAARTPDSAEDDDKTRPPYDQLIVVWDVATGERLHELRVPEGVVTRLAFSPEGKRLAASYAISEDHSEPKSGVVLFDVGAGRLLRQLSEFRAEIGSLQFSPSGRHLRVSEWNGSISSWDVATGKRVRLWKPPPAKTLRKGTRTEGAVVGVMSPDGRVIVWEIACCSRGGCPSVWMEGLRVVDAVTNWTLYQKRFTDPDTESNHHELTWSFAFTSDGKRLAADCNKFVVWDAATGKEVTTFAIPAMTRFVLAPDGRRAVIEEARMGEQKARVRLWNIESRKPLRELFCGIEGLEDGWGRTTPVFSADGKTLLAATESTLRVFDAGTGDEHAISGHRAPVTPRFTADGRTLFTTCAEQRCCWDVSGNKPALLRPEPRKAWELVCLATSAADQLFVKTPRDICIRQRNTDILRVRPTSPRETLFADFSPDATRLIFYEEYGAGLSRVLLYDVQIKEKSGEINETTLRGPPVFSPNGRLIACADCDGEIHLYDATTGRRVRTLRSTRRRANPEQFSHLCDFLFSPDGEKLIETSTIMDYSESGSGIPVRMTFVVFEVSSGRQRVSFASDATRPKAATPVSCMDCSPDGRLLAIAERKSGDVRILELASGKVRVAFKGHRHGVHRLAFSPDGKTLASGGEDNVVFLWDVTGTKAPAAEPQRSMKPKALWNDLASEDAKRAGVAIAALLRTPDRSVALLHKLLRPAEDIDERRLAQWIADLDADDYATREKATRELFGLGERAEATMRHALRDRPSLEVRRRIEDLLNQLEIGRLPLETLQVIRAIEVLEHIGTSGAQGCLEKLANGAPGARTTREAKAALRRLAERK